MTAKRITRVSFLAGAVLLIASLGILVWVVTPGLRPPAQVPAPAYWPTDGWQTRSPEELGFEPDRLAKALQALQENQAGIDSLLIIHDGYAALDAHFAPYDGAFPHDMASVTKSVMTTLIAIAADQGYIDLDRPVVSYFPGRMIANLDERKQRMTVRHLAGMVNGMESGCVDGDEATLEAMRAELDWVQAALDRPMVAEPGSRFCYDSPGMHLLSAVLQEATGMTALDFARRNLFEPLGIQEVIWDADPQGYTRGWGDLHLLPGDAAKIGYLWLHRGNWDGRQIVPEAWVLDSVRPHSMFVEPYLGYGYGWWISMEGYEASGRGGQYIGVVAARNTVVVTTGADLDYADIASWLNPILLSLQDSRQADAEGQASLEAALAAVEQDGAATAIVPFPDMAQTVSGRTYHCESNPASVETIRLNLDDPGQATLLARMGGTDMAWTIGLDGRYRLSPEGEAFRGYWQDAQTFQFIVFDVGALYRQLRFEGDSLDITLPELDMTVTCHAQE